MSNSATPWTTAHLGSLSITNSWSLFKLLSVKLVMQSHISSSFAPFSSHLQSFPASGSFPGLFRESVLHIRCPKYWSFSFRISPSSEYSGLISFSIDWLDLFAVQGILESSPTPQFKSINSSALSILYSPILTSLQDYWKNHSFDLDGPLLTKQYLCFLMCCLGWS